MLNRKRNCILIVKRTYVYLFVVDTIYLLISFKLFLQYGLEIKFESNLFWSKVYTYLSYSFSSIPIWLSVYITFERYVSFQYPAKSKLLRNERNQFIFFICIIIFILIFYSPIFYLINNKEILASNLFNNFLIQCNVLGYNKMTLVMILTNRTFLPFSFMIIFSFFLVRNIYLLKEKFFFASTFRECAKFKKEVRASLVSITINLFIILSNLSLIIVHFKSSDSVSLYIFTFYWFVLNYGIKFYLIILSTHLFNNKSINFILRKKSKYVSFTQNKLIMEQSPLFSILK